MPAITMRLRHTIPIFFVCVLLTSSCELYEELKGPSQFGTIQGQVTVDGLGQGGVTVYLGSDRRRSTTTDGAGTYSFPNVEVGTHLIEISGLPSNVICPTTSTAELAIIQFDGQTVERDFSCETFTEGCTEQPLEQGIQFQWGGTVREKDDEGSTDVQASVEISGVAEFVPGTQDADRGTWTTFTPLEGVLDIGTTTGGEEIDFRFDIKSKGPGTALWIFRASDEGGVRGIVTCEFIFE